jgi:hypothetical protein
MVFGVSDFVNYGTIAIWTVGVVVFVAAQIERLRKGEPMKPLWLHKLLTSNIFLAVLLAIGLLGSCTQAYLLQKKPKVIVQTVEKPIDRIVEKIVQKDCPQAATLGKPKRSTPPPPTMSQECHGGDCAQSYGQSGGITAGRVEVNTPPKRTLTETQKQGIKDFLQNIPQTVLITVGSVYGSGDGDMYANQFFPLFDGRHYEHQSAASIRTGFPAEFTGVFVATTTEDDPAVAYRDAFVRKLVDLRINAAASNGSKVTKGNLELIIGYRPEEVKER